MLAFNPNHMVIIKKTPNLITLDLGFE